MKCDRRLLSEYRDGDLSPKERSAVETHLKSCAECRRILREYEGISRGIRALPRYEAPSSLRRDVYDKVKAGHYGAGMESRWGGPLRFGSLAAVTLVMVMAAAVLARSSPEPQNGGQPVGPAQNVTYVQPTAPSAVAVAPITTPAEKGVQKVAPPTPIAPSQTADAIRPAENEVSQPVAVQPPPAASEAAFSKGTPSILAQAPVPVTIAAPPAKPELPRTALPTATLEAPRSAEAVPATPTRESLPAQTLKPTGTPTPTPPSGGFSVATTVEVTGSVTVTATANCAVTPKRDFGQVYVENPDVRRRLGCATGEEKAIQLSEESFENGVTFWRSDNRQIYVLLTKGAWKVYRDTFSEADPPLAAMAPPEGRFAPVRGVGKLWREDSNVRAALDWGIEPERGYAGQVQDFEKGVMLWSDRKGTFVLDGAGTWQNYPDTLREAPSPTPVR